MLVLTSEFSLTVAYDICDTNPWARIFVCGIEYFRSVGCFLFIYQIYYEDKNAGSSIGQSFPERQWCVTAVIMPLAICCFYFLFVKGTFASQNLTMKEMINALTLSVLSLGILPAVTEEMGFSGE